MKRTPLARKTPLKQRSKKWLSSKSLTVKASRKRCESATTAEPSAVPVDFAAGIAQETTSSSKTKTPLKRSTTLKRTRMKRKRRRGDKPTVRYDYMATHQACAVTWARAGQFGVVLDPHHLVAGAGRKDDPRNLLAITREIHNHYHFGGGIGSDGEKWEPLTPGNLLWCKREADGELDEAFICELLGRKSLPENWTPTPPPACFLREREKG